MDLNQNEKLLWNALQTGDQKARSSLIEKYTPLVKYVAGRVKMVVPPHVEFDDLVGFGIIGLITAVDRFNPERKIKFSTYATSRIRGSIIDGLRSLDWISRSGRTKAKRLNLAYQTLEQRLGRRPNDDELAGELNLTMEEFKQFIVESNLPDLTSLDVFIDPENGTSLIDLIPDQSAGSDEIIYDKEIKAMLTEAIERLKEQEKLVLSLYYYDELTQMEIAQVLDLSPARISQIHSKTILKLRGMLSRKKVLFF